MEDFYNKMPLPDELKALVETVKRENLSMLIWDAKDGTSGFIFGHLHPVSTTILRSRSDGWWAVYDTNSYAMKSENIYERLSLPNACQTALRLARAGKTQHSDCPIERSVLGWTLDEAGTLTLFGKGRIPRFEVPEYYEVSPMQVTYEARAGNPNLPKTGDIQFVLLSPWNGNRVKRVVVSPGLTSLCANAFAYWHRSYLIENCCEQYQELEEIVLPDTMVSLERNCIYNCPKLKKVYVPDSVKYIDDNYFSRMFQCCPELTIYTPDGSYAQYFARCHNIPTVTYYNTTPTNELSSAGENKTSLAEENEQASSAERAECFALQLEFPNTPQDIPAQCRYYMNLLSNMDGFSLTESSQRMLMLEEYTANFDFETQDRRNLSIFIDSGEGDFSDATMISISIKVPAKDCFVHLEKTAQEMCRVFSAHYNQSVTYRMTVHNNNYGNKTCYIHLDPKVD